MRRMLRLERNLEKHRPGRARVGRRSEREYRDMARPTRGVGYCQNTCCEDFGKGVFLLNHAGAFTCPDCRRAGRIEHETGCFTGDSHVFREVRVEYSYDPETNVYRDVAIVRDTSLWESSSAYTLRSPLVRTEKRALKVAEALLANLNRAASVIDRDEIPCASEAVLSFDDGLATFTERLARLAREWESGGLRNDACA
jgi:hypothetical protein